MKDNRAGKQGSTTTTEDDDGSTSQGRKTWLHRVDATILLIGAVVSLAAYFIVKDWEVRSQETHFVRLAEARCSSVENELVHYVHALRFVRRFFDGSQLVESDEFAEFVAPVLVDHPEIRTLGWAPRINDADRAAFERTLQADRGNNTRITDSCFLRASTVTPRREEYYPVLYHYPPAVWTMGCDLLSVPAREEAIKRARDEGGSAITEKIALGPEKADGVIIFEPIYTNGLPITTIEERRTAIRGVAMCAIRINDIIRGVLWHLEPAGIDIAVLDASASEDKQLLYQYWSRRRDTSAAPIVADDEPDLRYVASFSMAGRTWELRCAASPEYIATHALWAQWAALLGGLCLTMLLAMYLRSRQRRSALIEALVEQRTDQLRESEEKFRNLASSLPEVVFETDIDGRILYVNENAYDKFGYSQDDFDRGLFLGDMLIPEDRKNAGEAVQRILHGKDIGINDYTALHKDGSTFPIIVRSRPRIQDGKPIGLRGIIIDITERKQMEDSLREREELLKKSQEIAHVGSWSLDLKNNVLTWSDETYRIFGLKPMEFGATYEAFLQAVHPDDRELVAQTYETALKNKQPYEVVHRVLRPDGTVRIVHEKSESIADESGEVLYSLGMVHDITERIQDQVTLQEREQKISSIFTSAPVGIGLAVDRVLTEVNYRLCEMLGYTAEELIGQNAQMLYVTQEEYESVGTEKYAQIQKYGTGTVETQFKRKDGRIIDVISSSAPLDLADLSKGVTFTANDITERKQAEKALIKSEQKARAAFNQTFQFMGLLELDGTLLEANQTALEFAGIEEKDVLGRPFWETIWWTHSAELQNKLRDAVKKTSNGQFMRFEVSHLAYNGTLHYVDFSLKPVKDESDEVRYLVAEGHDITERKLAEEALRTSKEFSEDLIETANAIVLTMDVKANITSLNSFLEKLTGYDRQEVLGKNWFKIFIPERDRRHIPEVFKNVLAQMPEVSVGENAIVCKNGIERIISWKNTVMKDSNAEVSGVLSIGVDVTESRRAENTLRSMVLGTSTTTGEKFFQSLIEHLVEGLGVRGALVGELEESPQRTVNTLAFFDKGKQRKNIQYDLSETPCEEVVLGRTSICFSDVRAQFPKDHILASLGIYTYVVAPLIGSSGDVLGVLAVMHDKPIADDMAIHVKSLLAVFAARAVAEIERLRSEGKLMTAKEKLQQESESLVEKNIALNQILEHIGQDMAKFREELATSTENLLMPIVEKLKKSKGHLPLKEVDHLEDAIKSILGKEIDVFRKNLTHLTGRELEVCKMIRDGYSSKDIADTLFISLETVHKHRESIRRKLQIKHAHINLAAYLKSRPWPFAPT